ncbi:MAG: hypothetical protein H7099_17575 [Gemmatimonadaceae bacterium]|nr:hypothetical protein [Gemmatimonadaceae bacterium]
MNRYLMRRRWRTSAGGGGGGGTYTSARRYVPLFTLPEGVTYNPVTGLCEGYSTGLNPSYTPSGNEVLLTDQGSNSANRILLRSTIDAAASDAVRIRLAPLSGGRHWGDEIELPNYNRVGVGMYIEPASVKDGTFTANRVTRSTTGMAPFRFAKDHAWGSPPGGNQELRSVFRSMGGGNFRLIGLDIQYDATWAATLANLSGSPGSERGSAAGLITNDSSVFIDRALVERCLVMGAEQKPLLRAIYFNGSKHGCVKSHVDNVHYRGNDSQCYLTTNGPGPMLLEDNYMAIAFGEGAMSGGGQTSNLANIPQDIIVRRNHWDFPQRFIDRSYELKNLFEIKVCNRFLIERNVFTGARMTGYDGQNYGLVIKAVAQNGAGTDTWNLSKNGTIRLNEFRDCANTLGFGGDFAVDEATNRQDFSQNRSVFTSYTTPAPLAIPGAAVQFATRGASDILSQQNLRLRHNTFAAPKAVTGYRRFLLDITEQTNTRVIGLQVYGNAFVTEEPVVDISGEAPQLGGYFNRNAGGFNAQTSWNSFTDKVDSVWDANAVVGPSILNTCRINGSGYGDTYHASQSAAGLTTFRHKLATGSALLTGDTDGGMQGCDHALLDSALAGVES